MASAFPIPFPWLFYANPRNFYFLAGRMIPWFAGLAFIFGVAGLWISFFEAPTDATQGEGYRVIFIHVPSAWMSLLIYVVMALWSAIGLVYKTKLSAMMAQSLAPTGALMTFLALFTGSFWGKPMWGTWWVWDARLTSELILLFLFLGVIALRAAIDDVRRADQACGVLALVGVVNVPIIYYSVQWWNTLHQGASVSLSGESSMAAIMLAGMLVMALSFWMYCIAISLIRVRAVILERETRVAWTLALVENGRQSAPRQSTGVMP